MFFSLRHASIALVAVVAAGNAGAKPALNPEGLSRLGRYDVLTFVDPAGGGINKGKAIGVFDATPDEIFRVVTEYDKYPEFAPRVVSSRVVDRQGDRRAFVMLKTDLPWPVSDAWVYAQFEHEQLSGATYRVRFWQIKGSMKRYSGSIFIEPWCTWKGGGKSAVTYELVVEPNSAAPKRFINDRVEVAVSKYVHALRQHINELHRLGLLHPVLPPNPKLISPLVGPRDPVRVDNVARRP
jgi:ribosome-associated toxin RatA of RatAB toxin-antitoxin module